MHTFNQMEVFGQKKNKMEVSGVGTTQSDSRHVFFNLIPKDMFKYDE